MRFGLRSIFIAVTIFALFGGCVGWLRYSYLAQVRDAKAVLAEFPEIDRVWFATNDDVELEVEQVYFTIAGEPDLILMSYGIDQASKGDFRRTLREALRKRQPVTLPSHAEEYSR